MGLEPGAVRGQSGQPWVRASTWVPELVDELLGDGEQLAVARREHLVPRGRDDRLAVPPPLDDGREGGGDDRPRELLRVVGEEVREELVDEAAHARIGVRRARDELCHLGNKLVQRDLVEQLLHLRVAALLPLLVAPRHQPRATTGDGAVDLLLEVAELEPVREHA